MSRRRDSSQDKQERVSRKQFGEYLEQNDWITADIVPDKGEDILVRIYDKGKSTGLSLYIQLKSVQIVENLKLKSGAISYSFEVADLEHWENQNLPVLLVVWDVRERRGWWAWAGDAAKILDKKNTGWQSKSKVQVHFPPENSLDEDGLDKIRHKLADLYYLIIAKEKPLNIQTKFVFPQTPEGRAKLAEFERHIASGDEIELDGQFIEQFELPEWWRRIYGDVDPKTMLVKFGPTKSDEILPVQIDFHSPELGSERIPYVELQTVKQGKDEITTSNAHQSIRTKFILRINQKSKETNITFKYRLFNSDAVSALQMLRIHDLLAKGCSIRITLLKTGEMDSLSAISGAIPPPPDELIQYVENIVAIQQKSGKILKILDENSFSLENVKTAEELVSIFKSGRHRQTGLVFTAELRRPAIEMIVEAHKKGDPLHFRLITEESYVEFLGERFDFGPMIQHINGKWKMPVDEVIAWLETAGEEDALKVRLVDVEMYEEFENWMMGKHPLDQASQDRITMIERLIRLEGDIRYQDVAASDEPEYTHVRGSIPILISAPHGAAHTRNGKFKEEDEFTGSLAQLIGQETGAHVLYARRRSTTDPNADPYAHYKRKLADIVKDNSIRFVLDLHGVKADRPYGIELGTARGMSCSEQERELIVRTLQEYGFVQNSPEELRNLWIDQKHTGAGNEVEERVIMFVMDKLQIPAAQFEVNAHLRIPQRRADATQKDKSFKGNPDMIVRTIQAFAAIVTRLAKQHDPNS